MKKILTTKEFAAELKVTPGRVNQMIKRGIIKPIEKIGTTWVISRYQLKKAKKRPGIGHPLGVKNSSGIQPDHGSRARYKRGCHCHICMQANNDYMRDYQTKRRS